MNDFKMPLSYRIKAFLFPVFAPQTRLKNWISELIWPRQKWLTKKIPRHWCDKVELIPICLYEMIVDFVEKEMDNVGWDWKEEVEAGYCTQKQADRVKQTEETILEIYRWIKVKKPMMQIAEERYLNLAFEDTELDSLSFELTEEQNNYLEKSRELEKEIEEEDQKMLHKIIEVRPYLWT